MAVVTRIAGKADAMARALLASLDGLTGQETADALLLAMIMHIETIDDEHHEPLARGVADALVANFTKAGV